MSEDKPNRYGFEADMLLPLDTITRPDLLRMYRGMSHGDDRHGVKDLEFPDVHHATSFCEGITARHRPYVRFRDPVTDVWGSCVVQADMYGASRQPVGMPPIWDMARP